MRALSFRARIPAPGLPPPGPAEQGDLMSHRKALVASVAAGVLASVTGAVFVVTGLVTTAVPAAAATTGCTVAYQNLNAWESTPTSGGFNATLALTNLGDPISHWTVT